MILVSLVFTAESFAQSSYQAQIRGVVTDPSGAVVQNAAINVTEIETNAQTTAKTDQNGYYVVNGLRPSRYTVKAVAPTATQSKCSADAGNGCSSCGTSGPE